MSIIQISKIQVRSGDINDLPQLSEGELGWATDANRLFIGPSSNVISTTSPEPTNIEVLTEYSTTGARPAGNIYEIQFNDGANALGASPNLTFNGNILAVNANMTVGNISGANAITANFFIGNIIVALVF
jgi:hypothetical protein